MRCRSAPPRRAQVQTLRQEHQTQDHQRRLRHEKEQYGGGQRPGRQRHAGLIGRRQRCHAGKMRAQHRSRYQRRRNQHGSVVSATMDGDACQGAQRRPGQDRCRNPAHVPSQASRHPVACHSRVVHHRHGQPDHHAAGGPQPQAMRLDQQHIAGCHEHQRHQVGHHGRASQDRPGHPRTERQHGEEVGGPDRRAGGRDRRSGPGQAPASSRRLRGLPAEHSIRIRAEQADHGRHHDHRRVMLSGQTGIDGAHLQVRRFISRYRTPLNKFRIEMIGFLQQGGAH